MDSQLVQEAAAHSHRMRLSFWDALIIGAAVEGGAAKLFSEDLQDGLRVDGMGIRNPFR